MQQNVIVLSVINLMETVAHRSASRSSNLDVDTAPAKLLTWRPGGGKWRQKQTEFGTIFATTPPCTGSNILQQINRISSKSDLTIQFIKHF